MPAKTTYHMRIFSSETITFDWPCVELQEIIVSTSLQRSIPFHKIFAEGIEW